MDGIDIYRKNIKAKYSWTRTIISLTFLSIEIVELEEMPWQDIINVMNNAEICSSLLTSKPIEDKMITMESLRNRRKWSMDKWREPSSMW